MKQPICLASAVTVLAFSAGAGLQEPSSIKDVMGKLHKGAKAPLGKLNPQHHARQARSTVSEEPVRPHKNPLDRHAPPRPHSAGRAGAGLS
jgi:hypothetical protein